MLRIVTLLVFVATIPMYAQFGPETFLPKSCQTPAQTSASQSAPGSILIAIINGAFEFDLLGTKYNSGMRLSDGKAYAWVYAFYAPNGDSVFFKPYGRLFGSCADASTFLPAGSIPAAQLGTAVVPNAYIQGAALISALNTDGDYVTFHAANPDSMPSVTVLTVSREAVLDFPAGTPFWFLSWVPSSQGSVGLTCFVQALTGQTICTGGLTSAVANAAAAAGFSIAPNPAFDYATLTLPLSWLGSVVTVEAVDATGSTTTIASNVHVMSAAGLSISLSPLQSGMYTVRVRNERQASVIPMSVVR